MNFIVSERSAKKYPTEKAIIAHFNMTQKMPKTRIKMALDSLMYVGVKGVRITPIENPDQSVGGKAFELAN